MNGPAFNSGFRAYWFGAYDAPGNTATKLTLSAPQAATLWRTPPLALTFPEHTDHFMAHDIDDTEASISRKTADYPQAVVDWGLMNSPDLSGFKQRGGKMIAWIGPADPAVSPRATIDGYQRVDAREGGQAGNFLKLFVIPGMNHCAGGVATGPFRHAGAAGGLGRARHRTAKRAGRGQQSGVFRRGQPQPSALPVSAMGPPRRPGRHQRRHQLQLGRKVELVRGDAANPQQGIATVEQLVTKDKVDLFTGTYISAISNTASDAALRCNRLYWETNAVAQSLTDRGLPNFVRTGPDGGTFAMTAVATVRDLIAPALKKEMKDLRVWIEHEDSIYGSSIAEAQKRMLEAFGTKVVGVGAHSARSIDLNDTVLRAKQANPDVLIQTGYVPDGNLLFRTARDQGFKPAAMLWVGTGDTPETLEAVGAASLEGVLVVGYPRTDVAEAFGPGAKGYLAAYRAKYKAEPEAPQGMASYTCLLILFEAIKAAGSTDMDKVRAAAARLDKPTGSYPTGFGVKFDKDFQNLRVALTTAQ